MTGGGFGGCTITLVEKNSVENLKLHLKEKYFEKYSIECLFYECLPSEGSGLIADSRKESQQKNEVITSPSYSCAQAEPTIYKGCALFTANKLTFFFRTTFIMGLFFSIKFLTRK